MCAGGVVVVLLALPVLQGRPLLAPRPTTTQAPPAAHAGTPCAGPAVTGLRAQLPNAEARCGCCSSPAAIYSSAPPPPAPHTLTLEGTLGHFAWRWCLALERCWKRGQVAACQAVGAEGLCAVDCNGEAAALAGPALRGAWAGVDCGGVPWPRRQGGRLGGGPKGCMLGGGVLGWRSRLSSVSPPSAHLVPVAA